MEKYYFYSIKTGELRVREGYTDGTHFIYHDEKGKHRCTFTGQIDDRVTTVRNGFRGHVTEIMFLKERDDRRALKQLIANRKKVVEDTRKRLKRLEDSVTGLEEMLEQMQ